MADLSAPGRVHVQTRQECYNDSVGSFVLGYANLEQKSAEIKTYAGKSLQLTLQLILQVILNLDEFAIKPHQKLPFASYCDMIHRSLP